MSDFLNVKAVTQLTGLNEHTLRAWERRYGAVRPTRLPNGRRAYSKDDVERLQLLVLLQERGFAIGKIADQSMQDLRALLKQSSELARPVNEGSLPGAIDDVKEGLEKITRALKRFDLTTIHHELNQARYRYGARVFALEIVGPLIRTVGELVAEEKFSIAQEHALSAILKAQLGDLLFNMSRVSMQDVRRVPVSFAIATLEGDHHDIGIMLSAVLCAAWGVRVFYIGPNIPAEPLAEAVKALGATHVLLGKAPLPPDTLKQPLVEYLLTLRDKLPEDIEIWVGGDIDEHARKLDVARPIRFFTSLTEFEGALRAL